MMLSPGRDAMLLRLILDDAAVAATPRYAMLPCHADARSRAFDAMRARRLMLIADTAIWLLR